jgi:hypothetical protein
MENNLFYTSNAFKNNWFIRGNQLNEATKKIKIPFNR